MSDYMKYYEEQNREMEQEDGEMAALDDQYFEAETKALYLLLELWALELVNSPNSREFLINFIGEKEVKANIKGHVLSYIDNDGYTIKDLYLMDTCEQILIHSGWMNLKNEDSAQTALDYYDSLLNRPSIKKRAAKN